MSEEKSLSAQLRSARQQRGMSIEDVQRQTGLSPNVLRGLEADRFDVVEAVITRMTLRDYAVHLGLDVEALLAQYDRVAGQSIKPVREPSIPLEPPPVKAARRSSGTVILRWAVPVAVALIVLFLLYHFFGGEPDQPRSGFTPSALPPSRVDETRSASAPTTERNQREAISSPVERDEPAGAAAESVEEPAAGSPETPSTAASPADEEADSTEIGETAPSPAEDALPPATEEISSEDTGDAATATSADDREIASPVSADTLAAETGERAPAESEDIAGVAAADSLLRLEVEAVDDTWVEIRSDRRVLFQGILPQGGRRSWTALEAFRVHAGRAHGLRYWFQGRLLGGGHLGEATRVLRFRASRSGVTLLDADLQPLEELSLQPDEQP